MPAYALVCCRSLAIGVLCVFTVFFVPGRVAAQSNSQARIDAVVEVDIRSDLGPVNRMVLGNNALGYLHGDQRYSAKGSGMWDPTSRMPNREMVGLAREAGVSSLRWPGGCGVHEFNWKLTVGPSEGRPKQPFGLGEFLLVAKEMGAVPVITIADFWGDHKDAADLVEYLNAPVGSNPNGGLAWAAVRAKQGHPEPYGVRWFEFGNETYHGVHASGTPTYMSGITAEDYSKKFQAVAAAMKEVDPAIKLGAILGPEVTFPLSPWSEAVLRETATAADFFVYHAYLPVLTGNMGGPPPADLFDLAFASSEQFAQFFDRLRAEIKRVTGRDIPLAITEFNGFYVQELPIPYRFSQGAAVQVADMLLQFLSPGRNIAFANYWQFSNEYWGMVRGYESPYLKRPAYHVYRLFNEHLGDRIVGTKTNSSGYRTKGGLGVLASGSRIKSFVLGKAGKVSVPWNLVSVADAQASTDDAGVLSVTLGGESNINYFHARIPLPAIPNMGYRVTGEMRSYGMKKGGAQLEIIDERGWTATRSSALSAPLRTSNWTPVTVDYVALPDARGIEIRARRTATVEQGRMEVRNLRLQTFVPDRVDVVSYVSAITTKSADKVSVFLVNRNVRKAVRVRLEGIPVGIDEGSVLAASAIDSTNEASGGGDVAPRALSLVRESASIIAVLPPHSFSVVSSVGGAAQRGVDSRP